MSNLGDYRVIRFKLDEENLLLGADLEKIRIHVDDDSDESDQVKSKIETFSEIADENGSSAKIRSRIARERFLRTMALLRKSIRNLIPKKVNSEIYSFGELPENLIKPSIRSSETGSNDELLSDFCDTISSFKKKGEFDVCVHKNSVIYQRLCFLEEGSPVTISGPYGSTKYLGGGAFYCKKEGIVKSYDRIIMLTHRQHIIKVVKILRSRIEDDQEDIKLQLLHSNIHIPSSVSGSCPSSSQTNPLSQLENEKVPINYEINCDGLVKNLMEELQF